MSPRALTAFVARRLAVLVLLVVVVSFCVFSLLFLAPGSAVQVLLGTRPSSPQLVHQLRLEYHLNDSFFHQYWIWLRGAVHLDFGNSIRTGQSVLSAIGGPAGMTLFLTAYAFILTLVIGIPLGVLAAMHKRSFVDRGVVGVTVVGVSTPPFVAGVVLLYVFAITLGWFPVYGGGSGFGDQLWHLTLPAVALALSAMALIVKLTRAAMINVLDQDFITFARSRGTPIRRVIVHHALRNALIPVVTASGLVFTALLTGVMLVEVVFAIPGIGALLINSVQNKDMPVVQAIAMIFAVVIVLANVAIDVIYALVDPRIRYGGGDA